MTESDATVDCIENTCAERDNIIRGLLFNRTVNVIAVSGREIVETAREIHGTSRVCTAALGRMLLAVSMMSAQLKSETDSITATIAGGGPAGNITVVGHMGGIVKGCITNPEVELPLNEFGKLDVSGAVGGSGAEKSGGGAGGAGLPSAGIRRARLLYHRRGGGQLQPVPVRRGKVRLAGGGVRGPH